MNRLSQVTRPILARSFSSTPARAGGLPQKEQWILDWKDPVPVSLFFFIFQKQFFILRLNYFGVKSFFLFCTKIILG